MIDTGLQELNADGLPIMIQYNTDDWDFSSEELSADGLPIMIQFQQTSSTVTTTGAFFMLW